MSDCATTRHSGAACGPDCEMPYLCPDKCGHCACYLQLAHEQLANMTADYEAERARANRISNVIENHQRRTREAAATVERLTAALRTIETTARDTVVREGVRLDEIEGIARGVLASTETEGK